MIINDINLNLNNNDNNNINDINDNRSIYVVSNFILIPSFQIPNHTQNNHYMIISGKTITMISFEFKISSSFPNIISLPSHDHIVISSYSHISLA